MKTGFMGSAAIAAMVLVCAAGATEAPSRAAAAADNAAPKWVTHEYLQVAGLFGESDEEKAARLAAEKRENDQDAAISDLKQRVQDLEQALQQSTGQNETLNYRVRELKSSVTKMQKDWDYKICTLTAQLMGVNASGSGDGLTCDANATAGASSATAAAADDGNAYVKGMGLLAKGQYDEASASFRSFVDTSPKDELAPRALYWIGNIAYLKQDYTGAASAFAEGLKSYSKSDKAPEMMVKLGQSLISLGQTHQGCLTLDAVKSKYSKAPAALLKEAARLRAKSCH